MEGHCSTGQRPQWAVVPMEEEEEGRRRERRGRPRKRWKDEEKKDLQALGVRKWRELVADRKKWKDIVRLAKANSGL